MSRIWTIESLLSKRPWQHSGFLVTTNGCFDLLHAGHARILRHAASFGGWVLVMLNSDESVAKIKGEGRPFVKQTDRAELLAAIRYVDGVMIFEEETPCDLLGLLRPAIHVKGGDWKAEDLPETPIVENGGGSVEIFPRESGTSTTEIAERIRS